MFDLGGVGSYCLIENNLCFNNGAGGINVLGGRADVINNTLYRNGWDTGLLSWKDEPRYAAELMVSGWKDHTREYSKKSTVRNNIIWTRGMYPNGLENDIDCLFENNLFWSDKGGDSIVLPEWVKNSVIAEPKFINAPRIDETFEFRGAQFLEMDFSDYDFKLKDDSPAIDAGVQVKLTEDLEKRLRPIGRMFDIGAFECF
jgi:parallel beta-helix repeat protein